MKLIMTVFLFLSALSLQAEQMNKNFSSAELLCVLTQAEEFRVKINLIENSATFTDSHSVSNMNYSSERMSTSIPEARVLIYVGADQGGSGLLQLEFNNVSQRIRLSTIETDGTVELLGFANCKAVTH